MKLLAENDVELTWYDEYDSKEWVSIKLLDGGEEGNFLDIDGLILSVLAWKNIANYLEYFDEQEFINENGVE